MGAPGEFENRETQSQDWQISAPGRDVAGGVLPGGNSGVGVPGYPVEVVSTYPILPLNATEFDAFTADPVDLLVPGSSGLAGVAQITYMPPAGYVSVLRKISWNVDQPKRYFFLKGNMGIATLFINGIANDAMRNVIIADSGEFDVHIIIPLNSTVTIKFDFSANYGTVAGTIFGAGSNKFVSRCHMRIYGHQLFSRGLPSNFEVGS